MIETRDSAVDTIPIATGGIDARFSLIDFIRSATRAPGEFNVFCRRTPDKVLFVMPPPFPPIIARLIAFACVIAATSVLAATGQAAADDQRPESPFVAVFIDAKTEKALGPFPYDRVVLAKAIDKSVASGARGVVLKFFIDKPKTADGDRALVDAAKRTKLLVPARLDDSEKDPNPLPEGFALTAAVEGKPLSGKNGWLPLPELSAVAHDLGFVDYRVIDRMPLVEQYRGKLVKSLYLSCLELALGACAEIVPARSIRIRDKKLELDEHSEIAVEYPAKDELKYISFSDFIEQPPRPELKDRIVISAYDSERFEAVKTPAGPIPCRSLPGDGRRTIFSSASQGTEGKEDGWGTRGREENLGAGWCLPALDEVQVRDSDRSWQDNELTTLIDVRHRAGLSTLLVSNLTPAELKQNVGDSIWRRLIETGGDPIEADWPRVQQ